MQFILHKTQQRKKYTHRNSDRKKQSVGYIVLYRDTDERKWEHSKVQKLATMVYKEERKRKRRGKQCQPVLTIYMVPPKN